MQLLKKTRKTTLCQLFCPAIIVALFTVASPAGATKYYKWTDEKGVTHFTDKPPKEGNSLLVDKTKRVPKTHEQAEAETKAAAEAAEQARIKEQRQKACDDEKQRLQTLKNNKKIQLRMADGSLKELSAAEIQEQIKKSEDAVKRACDGL